jgi:hypothetical protein
MKTKTTDTPRTDEACEAMGLKAFVVPVETYRQLERELADKINEVARLREQLTRVIGIAEKFRWHTRTHEWISMKDELDKIKTEHEARLATAPEEPENDWKCPHCGSTTGAWFSRVEPMGDFCEDCGKSVDEEPVTEKDTKVSVNDQQHTENVNDHWRELGPDEVIQEGDEFLGDYDGWMKCELYVGKRAELLGRVRTRRPFPKREEMPRDIDVLIDTIAFRGDPEAEGGKMKTRYGIFHTPLIIKWIRKRKKNESKIQNHDDCLIKLREELHQDIAGEGLSLDW